MSIGVLGGIHESRHVLACCSRAPDTDFAVLLWAGQLDESHISLHGTGCQVLWALPESCWLDCWLCWLFGRCWGQDCWADVSLANVLRPRSCNSIHALRLQCHLLVLVGSSDEIQSQK